MKVCSGGIVGMGEQQADRAGLLQQLANLPQHPESVPINMLVRVEGTPLADEEDLDPFEFIRTIAVARIMMPASHVRLSAGREEMNEQMHALAYFAGANSIFYGEKLLTTPNPRANADMALFARLGIEPEQRQVETAPQTPSPQLLRRSAATSGVVHVGVFPSASARRWSSAREGSLPPAPDPGLRPGPEVSWAARVPQFLQQRLPGPCRSSPGGERFQRAAGNTGSAAARPTWCVATAPHQAVGRGAGRLHRQAQGTAVLQWLYAPTPACSPPCCSAVITCSRTGSITPRCSMAGCTVAPVSSVSRTMMLTRLGKDWRRRTAQAGGGGRGLQHGR